MRLPLLTSLQLMVAAIAAIEFINPPPSGPDSQYNLDASYAYGSQIEVQWTPTNESISITLNQQTNGATFEYLFQNKVGLSRYSWTVATTKSLSVSRIFFLELFITGQTTEAAISHYFNITGNPPSSTSSSANVVAATATSSGATSIAAPTHTALTKASATPKPLPSTGGLSLGAKIAIGVIVPVVVIAALLAGWFFFARRRKRRTQVPSAYAQPHYDQPYNGPAYQDQPYRGGSSSMQHQSPPQRNVQAYQMPGRTQGVKEMDSRRSLVELPQTRL